MTGTVFNGDASLAASSDLFDPDEVLTTIEVAQRLKLKTPKAIRGAIRRRELTASLIGREYRISGQSANLWLQRQQPSGTAPVAPVASVRTAACQVVPSRRARRQPILGQGR